MKGIILTRNPVCGVSLMTLPNITENAAGHEADHRAD
jgi:hypothetical protein